MASGEQGTLFTHVEFLDTLWHSVELYYYDNNQGGQGDETTIDGGDTGDSLSFGDQGIIFRQLAQQSVSLKLGFTAYFLPGNQDKAFGEQLAAWVENPVKATSIAIDFPTGVQEADTKGPETFALYQNYPNPFNSSTIIKFSLPHRQDVRLRIIDLNGRVVKTLVNSTLDKGVHQLRWNGLDERQQEVASGVYFYQIQSGDYVAMKKLILVH